MSEASHPLAVTVDIEDWYHIPSVTGSPFSTFQSVEHFHEHWDDHYDYLSEPTNRVLRLLNQQKITATFFVVADVVKYYPGLVELIAEEGHEIACHDLNHACAIDPRTKSALIDQESFEQNVHHARRILERASGQSVVGYRAPNALISGWMLDSLRRLNFSYDSSVCVNSFYSKSADPLQKVSSYPYHPAEGALEPGGSKDFFEFPWPYWDLLGVKIPTTGGPILRFLGSQIILNGLQQSLRRGKTIFYFHPIDISEKKFPNIGNKRPFYWCIKGKVIEKRIERILRVLKNQKVPMKPIRDMLE